MYSSYKDRKQGSYNACHIAVGCAMKISLSSDIGRQLGLMCIINLISMLLLFYLFFNAFSSTFYAGKQQESKHLSGTAHSIVEGFYKLNLTHQATEIEAKQMALLALRQARYDVDGYFWINSIDGIMILHPAMPHLEYSNVSQVKDGNGVLLFQEFIKQAKSGGGWVEYLWAKPNQTALAIPKLSYVTLFEPWGWVIGTGLYLDDVEQQKNAIFIKSIGFIISAFLLSTLLSIYIAHRSTQAIKDLAIRDPLTKLYTRRYLNETEDSFVREDSRDKSNRLYVLFLDIDYFKSINDTYGHRAGDEVLKELGKILQQSTRPQDLCVRYGGEEFVILTLGTSDEHIYQLAERTRQTIKKQTFVEGIKLTISIGIAKRGEDEDFPSALNRADRNLYAAKDKGRDCVVMDQ